MEFRLDKVSGAPTIFVDGRPTYLSASKNGADQAEYFASFRDQGFRFHKTNVEPGWLGAGRYEFSEADRHIGAVLDADPDAGLMLEVHTNAPAWWLEEHPEQRHRTHDGRTWGQSVSSQLWQADTEDLLRAFCRHVAGRGWAERTAMVFVGCLHTWEWFYRGAQIYHMMDVSEPAVEGFRAWLRARYGSTEALSEAWQRAVGSWEEAVAPEAEEELEGELGSFRDPVRHAALLDYYRYLAQAVATAVERFLRTVKESWPAPVLTGAFYGHILDWIGNPFVAQRIGHLATAQLLDSPWVDALAGPNSYMNRDEQAPMTGAIGSVSLHGKLWVAEFDTRTHLAEERQALCGRPNCAAEAKDLLKRDLGNLLCHGGTEAVWFSLLDGWFEDAEVLDQFGEFRRILDEAAARDRGSVAQIAVFVDEDSLLYQTPFGSYASDPFITHEPRLVDLLRRMGAPYDLFLLSDLPRVDPALYRLAIFVNAYRVPDHVRAALDERWKCDGRTLLWFYAPGLVTSAGLSTESAADLAGMELEVIERSRNCFIELTDNGGAPIVSPLPDLGWVLPNWVFLDSERTFGTPRPVAPLLAVREREGVQVLGTYVGHNAPALALADCGGWSSLFCGCPFMPPPLLRRVLSHAGCHVYLDSDDVFYANRSYLAVFGFETGGKTVRLPAPSALVPLFATQGFEELSVAEYCFHLARGHAAVFQRQEP